MINSDPARTPHNATTARSTPPEGHHTGDGPYEPHRPTGPVIHADGDQLPPGTCADTPAVTR